jgi:hypothetical protein
VNRYSRLAVHLAATGTSTPAPAAQPLRYAFAFSTVPGTAVPPMGRAESVVRMK